MRLNFAKESAIPVAYTHLRLTFVECSGEITPTAQALFIHRNTLKYRLDKIFEITKRDPQNLEDLFYLYTAVVHYLLVKRGLDAPHYTCLLSTSAIVV